MTKHMHARMSQRGINADLVELALQYGYWDGDRCHLNRKALDRLLAAVDVLRSKTLKARDKGGLTVVHVDGQNITTYAGGKRS